MDIFELFFNDFSQAKQLVLSGQIDMSSLSEAGSHFFHYATYFGDTELMHYCYDKVDLSLLNETGTNALELSLCRLDSFKKTLAFYQEKNLPIHINLIQVIKNIRVANKENFSFYLNTFSPKKEDVFEAITQCTDKIQSQQLLETFFHHYQDDPYAFILKLVKEEMLYPFFTTHQEQINSLTQFYQKCLEGISEYNQENFLKLYEKVKEFKLSKEDEQKHQFFLPEANKESFMIHAIKHMDKEKPLSLFSGFYEPMNSEIKEKLKEIKEQYHFRNIIVHNQFFNNNSIDEFIDHIEQTKSIFNLSDEEVGHDSLDIYFDNEPNNKINDINGYYEPNAHYIVIHKYLTNTIFVHEYTHAQQFLSKMRYGQSVSCDEQLNQLMTQMSKHQVSKEETIDFMLSSVKHTLHNTDKLKDLIHKMIDFKNSFKDMKVAFEKEIKNNIKSGHDYSYTLSKLKTKLDSYKQNSHTSLAINYFKKLDQSKKMDNRDVYWNEDIEIHARLNERMIDEHANFEQFNESLVNYIKPHLDKFNLLLAQNMRVLKENNELPNKKKMQLK